VAESPIASKPSTMLPDESNAGASVEMRLAYGSDFINIYGQNIANPIAIVWSGALMLDFLGRGQGAGKAAHDAIVKAIETVLREGPRTRDLGGSSSTTEIGKAVAALV
jgi:isocitrate/isopropylmalate dehydrogenase